MLNLFLSMGFTLLEPKDYETLKVRSLNNLNILKNANFSIDQLKFFVGLAFAPTVPATISEGMKRYQFQNQHDGESQHRLQPVAYFTEFLRLYTIGSAYKDYLCSGNLNSCVWNFHLDDFGKVYGKSLRSSIKDHFSFDEGKYPHFYFSELESIGFLIPNWQRKRVMT